MGRELIMNHRRKNYLFSEEELENFLNNRLREVSTKVGSIPKDQFLATPEEDIVGHIYSIMKVEPLTLYEDSKELEQQEIKIDVSNDPFRNPFRDRGPIYVNGVRVIISIPYSGDSVLWKLRPSRWQSVFPSARVSEPDADSGIGHINIIIEQPVDEPIEKIKKRYEQELRDIKFFVDAQKPQIEDYNTRLSNKIKDAIKDRKERLKIHEGIVDLLEIPLKHNSEAPPIQPIPIKKRLVKPLPPPPKSGYKPEPGITDKDYEDILTIIRHEGRTFETTPKTFAVHNEEELRDIILAHLNGHFLGDATGETFRKSGKTDIRIEDKDRAAFVAECKIWRGAKELSAAIDQLLGYLTWRDCKAAIIIFNKDNANFTKLLNKIPEILRSHPRFKKELLNNEQAGEWRYLFTSLEDELRHVIVHIFIFNLYAPQNDKE